MAQVAVVIPAYNAAATLEGTLASVRDQTLTDWELVVVDDGSIDGTAELVRGWSDRDPRIQLLQCSNGGVSRARNTGVAATSAPLIAFLDADDLWRPAKLAAHVAQFAAHTQLGVAFSRVAFLRADGQPTGVISSARLHRLRPQHFLEENPTCTTSSWVVRRCVFNSVGGFTVGMQYSEDLEWLFRASLQPGWEIEGLKAPLTGYRTQEGGLSADLERMEDGWQALMDRARTIAPDVVARHGAHAEAVHLRYLARRAIRLQQPARRVWGFLSRSLRCSPWLPLQEPRRTLLTIAAALLVSLRERLTRLRRGVAGPRLRS
ncbi:glycosyltransferase family 2 protein [Synechococcus sp. RSCCF101]|uniref:glycosyltransferase family 2 protein n=1 Tax=Synechococcus sp. RSCCF101 TaxID=2511069 RepID=UPI001247DE26|nr:glycosyltransferase family A protein [Synechococcus sp. RSCCF101]QEY31477.1 glycosyltransferase family 2 protein [Synechococcus sp. RSCCF101]